jgi:hypothetical protein
MGVIAFGGHLEYPLEKRAADDKEFHQLDVDRRGSRLGGAALAM